MTDTDRDTPALDELWTMLKDQQAEIEELKASLQGQEHTKPGKGEQRDRASDKHDGRLSRAGLLKGAIAGLGGVAAAELAGTIGAAPAAAGTDMYFNALGGDDTAFSNGAGYFVGAQVTGSRVGVSGDATGSFDGPVVGVSGNTDNSPTGVGVWGTSGKYIGVIADTRAADHSGIWGFNSSNSGWGVWGASYISYPNPSASNLGNGVGVRGESGGGIGVHGTSVSLTGGFFSGGAIGIQGYSDSGIGGHFTGKRAPLFLNPASQVGPPTTGPHSTGEIFVDSAGGIWSCVGRGAPGTWVPLRAFESFPDPRRVFSQSLSAGTTTGPIDATAGSSIPAGAKAAYCAVQVVPSSPGSVTLFPAGSSDPGIANYVAMVAGVLNLIYMLVPLNGAGQFQIHTYVTGDHYVDAWGFLR